MKNKKMYGYILVSAAILGLFTLSIFEVGLGVALATWTFASLVGACIIIGAIWIADEQ